MMHPPTRAQVRTRVGDQPWLKWSLIGLALVLTALMLVVPLVSIFVQAFGGGVQTYLKNLQNTFTLHAIGLTLLVAAFTVPINLIFGVMLAWLVTRFDFFGRKVLITLIDIPFAVSPIIAGLVYLLLYGRNGWLGQWFLQHDIQLMFAWPGIVLVTIFVTSPFVARELIPFMQQQGSEEEEAAVILGASGWRLFRRVTLPNIRWALIYGVVLTNARAVGEFGAVSVVSGNIRGKTNTLPLHIELLYQDYNIVGAFAASSLLAAIALLTLVLKALMEWRQERQHADSQESPIESASYARLAPRMENP
jgi:sulfate transport system permease protein